MSQMEFEPTSLSTLFVMPRSVLRFGDFHRAIAFRRHRFLDPFTLAGPPVSPLKVRKVRISLGEC